MLRPPMVTFQNRIACRREVEYNFLKKERDDRISQLRAERRREREIKRKLLFYLKTEEERMNRLHEEEEARKREELERRKKEEADRKAKLDEIAERQKQREKELEERERLRKEALLSRPSEPPLKAADTAATGAHPPEPVAAPAAAAAAAAAPTTGKYVPRFLRGARDGESGGGAATLPEREPDRWGRQDDRPPQTGDRWRSDRSFSGGGSRYPSSSSSWSSSRGRN